MEKALWAEGTQKCATTWYRQHFTVDGVHEGVEDKEVTKVYIWRGL